MLSTSSIPSAEIPVLVAAMIGGSVIVLGLILEKLSEKMDDKFLGGYKAHTCLGDWGWAFVTIGVAWEVAVAGWSANDAWQTRQMAIKNAPINLPVTEISASATIEVAGTNFDGLPQPGPHLDTWMESLERTRIRTLYLGSLQNLTATDVQSFDITGNGLHNHGYKIQFQRNPFIPVGIPGVVIRNNRPVTPKIFMERIKALRIHLPFVPKQAVVLGGTSEILINGTFSEEFQIPPQKTDEDLCVYATNSMP